AAAPAGPPAPSARRPEQSLELEHLPVAGLERLLVPRPQQLWSVRPPPRRQLVTALVPSAELTPRCCLVATRAPVARLGLATSPFIGARHDSPLRVPTCGPALNRRKRPPLATALYGPIPTIGRPGTRCEGNSRHPNGLI